MTPKSPEVSKKGKHVKDNDDKPVRGTSHVRYKNVPARLM